MRSYGMHDVWITDQDSAIDNDVAKGVLVEPSLILPEDLQKFREASSGGERGVHFGAGITSTGYRVMGIYPHGYSLEAAMKAGLAIV